MELLSRYPWNVVFTLTGLRSYIEETNLKEVGNWIQTDNLRNRRLRHHGVHHDYDLSDSV